MKTDYEKMAVYFTKSAKTLKRWEVDKPQKFELMLEDFQNSLKDGSDNEENELIVCANLKGGATKSTISDALSFYLGDSVVLNVDISQSAKNVNASDTIDYSDYIGEISLKDLIKKLYKKYKFIIVDTPGAMTKEILEVLSMTKKVVMPMVTGKRSREATENSLEVFFGNGSSLEGKYTVYFVIAAFTDVKKRDIAKEKFTKMYKGFTKSDNITISPKIGTLGYSGAIVTAEEEGKSIFELAKENKMAYKSILDKMGYLCKNIEAHLDL